MTTSVDRFVAEPATTTLRFGAQNPGHSWWSIADRIIESLVGFSNPLLPNVRCGLYTPSALQGARLNPVDVAAGNLDVAITTPAATAWMATHGVGVYDTAHRGLRGIASFPHIDFVVFMVDASTGIRDLSELRERRYPLKLVTGRKADAEPDILTFVVGEVLRRYGAPYEAIEEWGGEVIYGGPTHIGGHLMRDGEANALFQEAQMVDVWHEIADSREVTVLPVADEIIEDMRRSYGIGRAEIPKGHYRGVNAPVTTLDFSGWLVFCREDLPDDYAYAVAQACDAIIPQADRFDPITRKCLRLPIDPIYLFRETVVPLHEGAARYAREHGYIS